VTADREHLAVVQFTNRDCRIILITSASQLTCQSNSSMHHYECVALCEDKSSERLILRQISSLMYPKIQRRPVIINFLHPSCARPPRWSPPILWRRFEHGKINFHIITLTKKGIIGINSQFQNFYGPEFFSHFRTLQDPWEPCNNYPVKSDFHQLPINTLNCILMLQFQWNLLMTTA